MAARSRKRKLPADLQEAEALVRKTSCARCTVMEAYKSLQALDLSQVQGVPQTDAVAPEALTIWLIAKFGIQEVQKMASILTALPETLTPSQKMRFFKKLCGRESDGDFLCATIQRSSLVSTVACNHDVKVLSPPIKQCTHCAANLTENHHCRVKLYTLSGVKEAEKVTFRCAKCRVSYNYDKFGDKIENGFRFYPEQRQFVEVNDVTYFQRQLLDHQCSLA